MKQLLAQLVAGGSLSEAQAIEVFSAIMSGQATPAQIGATLALIQARGPTEDELVGATRVMRAKVTAVQVPAGLTVIDTCGTGGAGTTTFNVSTAAGLVAAAIGRPHGVAVAKHGNRAFTSISGSSQALEALGVKLDLAPATLTRCLDQAGFCFCFAPAHHPAMKHAAPVRSELGFRTIFNLLGPLTNPAGARRQVIGVFAATLTEPLARVLARLGAEAAMVVHGRLSWESGAAGRGLGELTTTGPTRITHLREGRVWTEEMDSRTLRLAPAEPEALSVKSPAESAQVVRAVLGGRRGAARDMVCLNAAAALVVAGLAADLRAGIALAAAAIDAGSAAAVLEKLVRISQGEK